MIVLFKRLVTFWLGERKPGPATSYGDRKPQAILKSSSALEKENSIVADSEDVYEIAKSLWELGDWQSLASMRDAALANHPKAAKLFLLKATALSQLGKSSDTLRELHYAKKHGIQNKLIAKQLVAGVYNTLGKAALISGDQQRALEYFEHSLRGGDTGNDINPQARYNEQLRQLNVTVRRSSETSRTGQATVLTTNGRPPAKTTVKLISDKYLDFYSGKYWEERYQNGGTSGYGSYGRLAEFKAKVINSFIESEDITKLIEFGCGDGNQLSMFHIKEYIGVDVSQTIIERCKIKFKDDVNKSFFTTDEFKSLPQTADLTLSLDVIFHLIEDSVYSDYMETLFSSANRFCVIYACNEDERGSDSIHVRRRKFTEWVEINAPEWTLATTIYNPYPFHKQKNSKNSSFSDFYFFVRGS